MKCYFKGWTFDGQSGECMEIPQTLIASTQKNPSSSPNQQNQQQQTKKKKGREDATAIAIHVQNGMVYLHPNYTPLEALAAMNDGTLNKPPSIPEMELEGYKTTFVVRDFPIDWSVLMENIMDPDQ